jgi:hypothetical protein
MWYRIYIVYTDTVNLYVNGFLEIQARMRYDTLIRHLAILGTKKYITPLTQVSQNALSVLLSTHCNCTHLLSLNRSFKLPHTNLTATRTRFSLDARIASTPRPRSALEDSTYVPLWNFTRLLSVWLRTWPGCQATRPISGVRTRTSIQWSLVSWAQVCVAGTSITRDN